MVTKNKMDSKNKWSTDAPVLKMSFQGARWKPNPQSLSYLHLKTLLIWIKALNICFDLVPDYTRSIASCKFSL